LIAQDEKVQSTIAMAVANWSDLFVAALGGGITVKLADIIYVELRRWWDSLRSAEQFVDSHHDRPCC
jgi:hypothetical protein